MDSSFGRNYLGIDWGASDVGIAFAESETGIAFALSKLRNDESLLSRLGELFSEHRIGTVVIGVPSHINREEAVYEGEILGEAIREHFSVEIAYQDEMFTTKMAQENLKKRGIKRISRFDDQEAARIILQEWLDRR
jgi:putative transcription antitermination factor YqgF